MHLYGIDGCREGWVVASRSPESPEVTVEILALDGLKPLVDQAESGAALIAIDIPIGMSDNRYRKCDLAARSFLTPRRHNSVFFAPCRCVLGSRSYSDGCDANFAACGKRMSLQLYHILHRIRVVDQLSTPARQEWIREAHPEVTFAALAGAPMRCSKKTLVGRDERRTLMKREGLRFNLEEIRAALGRCRAVEHDLLDALACLVTADRIRRGAHLTLPTGEPDLDSRGLRMEIVA